MLTIDYALAYDFVDPANPTIGYRLEFRYQYQPPNGERASAAIREPRPFLPSATTAVFRWGQNSCRRTGTGDLTNSALLYVNVNSFHSFG